MVFEISTLAPPRVHAREICDINYPIIIDILDKVSQLVNTETDGEFVQFK